MENKNRKKKIILFIILVAVLLIAIYYYENIAIAATAFAAAIFFAYISIACGVYVMLIVPAGCLIYGIIAIKDNPPKRKTRHKEDK